MEKDLAELRAFYWCYLERCSAHRFEELGEFVAAEVRVNDAAVGVAGYIAGLRAVVEAFRLSLGPPAAPRRRQLAFLPT